MLIYCCAVNYVLIQPLSIKLMPVHMGSAHNASSKTSVWSMGTVIAFGDSEAYCCRAAFLALGSILARPRCDRKIYKCSQAPSKCILHYNKIQHQTPYIPISVINPTLSHIPPHKPQSWVLHTPSQTGHRIRPIHQRHQPQNLPPINSKPKHPAQTANQMPKRTKCWPTLLRRPPCPTEQTHPTTQTRASFLRSLAKI